MDIAAPYVSLIVATIVTYSATIFLPTVRRVADYGERLTLAVAAQLRALRLERGLSHESLAQQAGLHRSTIGLVESGRRGLTISAAGRLASALGVRLSEVLTAAERDVTDER